MISTALLTRVWRKVAGEWQGSREREGTGVDGGKGVFGSSNERGTDYITTI